MPPKAPRAKGGGTKGKEKEDTGTTASSAGSEPSVSSNAAPLQQNAVKPEVTAASVAASSSTSTRLDTLKASSSAAPSPRGRKGPVAKPKFVGRRSQAARAELEREEAAKKAAEEAEALEIARRLKRSGHGDRGRGRGGRGRGRGGFAGDSQRPSVASGPFSSGQATQDIRSGYVSRSGWGSSGGGSSSGAFGGGSGSQSRSWGNGGSRTTADGIKIEGGGDTFTGSMGRMRSVKTEDGGYISSDDEDLEGGMLKKQNVDELQNDLVDLTSAEDDLHGNPFAPIRVPRAPVKDRKVGLSAEEVSKRSTEDDATSGPPSQVTDKKKGKASLHDVEITGSAQRPRRATAYSSASDTEDKDKIKIKAEPADDEQSLAAVETTALTTPLDPDSTDSILLKDPPSSPESRRKAKQTLQSAINRADLDDVPFRRPKTPTYPTQQEVDEFHRKWDDRATVFAELGRAAVKIKSAPETATDGEGNVKMADSSAEKSVRDDQVYLFQFPPIMPDLYPVDVKPDPDAPENIDTQNSAMDIDQENKQGLKEGVKPNPGDGQIQEAQLHLPAGRIGKLRVHKSGRAFLDWGGNNMILQLGIQTQCLQNVMIAKVPDTKPDVEADQQSDDAGRAMGLGEVKAKFVAIPQFFDPSFYD